MPRMIPAALLTALAPQPSAPPARASFGDNNPYGYPQPGTTPFSGGRLLEPLPKNA